MSEKVDDDGDQRQADPQDVAKRLAQFVDERRLGYALPGMVERLDAMRMTAFAVRHDGSLDWHKELERAVCEYRARQLADRLALFADQVRNGTAPAGMVERLNAMCMAAIAVRHDGSFDWHKGSRKFFARMKLIEAIDWACANTLRVRAYAARMRELLLLENHPADVAMLRSNEQLVIEGRRMAEEMLPDPDHYRKEHPPGAGGHGPSWGPEPWAERTDRWVGTFFAEDFPENAANLPAAETRIAVQIWEKFGKGRTTTALPAKWEHLAKLMDLTGIGEGSYRTLETDWNTWRAPSQSTTARRPPRSSG